MAAALVACGESPAGVEEPSIPAADDIGDVVAVPLTSDEYAIVEMAAAHGVFTVEVEVDPGVDTGFVARRLVEPVQDRYVEVLVYFYDRTADGHLPSSRVQWTPVGGYITIEY